MNRKHTLSSHSPGRGERAVLAVLPRTAAITARADAIAAVNEFYDALIDTNG